MKVISNKTCLEEAQEECIFNVSFIEYCLPLLWQECKTQIWIYEILANFNFREEEFFQYHTFFNLMIHVLAIIVHKMYNIAR